MRYLFFFLLISSCSYDQKIYEADLIISSNNVISMTGNKKAQALSIAIKNERIIWMGSHRKAKKIKGKHVNFGNQAVLPGFIDAHGHASYLAFATQVANIAPPPVGEVNSIKELQDELKNLLKTLTLNLVNG
jgi:predicted amidohydrolase YtcJ